MKPAIVLAVALVTLLLNHVEPIWSTAVNLMPTPSPCGYASGHLMCVKHRLVCPVW